MRTSIAVLITVACAHGQMEKRWIDRYDGNRFANAAPRVGALTPNLICRDLAGRTWSLHEQLGRTVVLLKAAYT